MLLVPRDLVKGSPSSPEAYRAIGERFARRDGREIVTDRRTLHAYVNRGIWFADCPRCNNGIIIHPGWAYAVCLGKGCYREFTSIEVPVEWPEIEQVLEERPVVNQHWLCGPQRTKWQGRGVLTLVSETVEELRAENAARLTKDVEIPLVAEDVA